MTTSQAPPRTFFAALVDAIRQASAYNRNDQEPPAAVLWTDRERQWESLLPRLRNELPLLTLGSYDRTSRTGPSYWLRCMIAGVLPEETLAAGTVPIIYLPGVSRQDMRAVEESPKLLQPLAELQYRGILWTHRNGRDWTVPGFLQSEDGGLSIEVGSDLATREAIERTLLKLADEPVERLRKEAPLRTAFFDALLHPDEVRNLLQWLNAPDSYRQSSDPNAWAAFRALCRAKYGFDPQTDGEITAARLLGERDGAWEVVWSRFREAPASHPNIPDLLQAARPTQTTLALWHHTDSWPQENEQLEAELRTALLALTDSTASEARAAVGSLEAEHGSRRDWVWAELGQSPLAGALQHLATLAEHTAQPLSAPSSDGIAEMYANGGWRSDLALLDTLASVELPHDVVAIKAASCALYRPWLGIGANALQAAIRNNVGAFAPAPLEPIDAGVCLLFCDGLRFDVAARLEEILKQAGYSTSASWRMTALPTVTPTAKPAISPVADRLEAGAGFDTVVAGKGTRVTAEVLRKLLSEAGYQVLKGDELGDPSGQGWTEMGTIDSCGHEQGYKLAHHIPAEIRALVNRIGNLLERGWKKVIIITDHGWLLLPGGLPKAALPEHLTELRKGRCARLKPLSSTDQQTVPWFWDPQVQVAVAPGVHCYEAGKEYEHGGISPQECVVPVLTVTRSTSHMAIPSIEEITWRGLRCVVRLKDPGSDVTVDIRSKPADASSSLVTTSKSPGVDGIASLLVRDDSLEGQTAMVIVVASDGTLLAQAPTVIGD